MFTVCMQKNLLMTSGTTLVYILYLNSKFLLRLQNAMSLQKKPESLSRYLFVRAL